jgi:hypothetical protein
MKLISFAVLLSFYLFSCGDKIHNKNEDQVIFNAILLGRYRLPADYNNYYFLVDLTLTNNTDKELKFWSKSCLAGANLLFNSDEIIPCTNDCSSSSTGPVELNTHQKINMPILLRAPLHNYYNIKFGYFLVKTDETDLNTYDEMVQKKKEFPQNIIWSNAITLSIGDESFVIE